MASIVYNEFKRASAAGEIDLNADDIRARLCMTNTTCDTENDTITNVSEFTTIDVCDDSGYSGDIALSTETVTRDDANDRAEFSAVDLQWTGLNGNATRDAQGVLLYKFVTNDAGSTPICFVDFATDIPSTATTINVPWDAQGILQLT